MKPFLASLRIAAATLFVCAIIYPLSLLTLASWLAPEMSDGSLIREPDGRIIGSRLIAQEFREPRYLWPRPSAVNYDAGRAGGSNLSPTNPALAEHARSIIKTFDVGEEESIPADLVTASGSGLDPHISREAAEFQVRRIAAARALPESVVREEIARFAESPGGLLSPAQIVNVLEVNLSLDRIEALR